MARIPFVHREDRSRSQTGSSSPDLEPAGVNAVPEMDQTVHDLPAPPGGNGGPGGPADVVIAAPAAVAAETASPRGGPVLAVPSVPDSLQPPPDTDFAWLDGEDFAFPGLKSLYTRKDEELRRHATAMAEIEQLIGNMKSVEQENFHNLLRSEGPALREAVIHALSYLGWGKVVDVHKYWRNVIRNKEEDVWLIEAENQPVEQSMRQERLLLLLVRSGRDWAADDEFALLQKYKGRRMQEFDNTKMKAILVGNYFCRSTPDKRSRPFSDLQIEEAGKDGNGLLTTFELFRAVKAEKEGRAAKEALRRQLSEKVGLIEFEY